MADNILWLIIVVYWDLVLGAGMLSRFSAGLALVSQAAVGMATSLVRLGYCALSIHWPAHHRRRSITVGLRSAAAAEHASYSTVFLSIDKHRRTAMQRQREEDGGCKKTDSEVVLSERIAVRLTEQTYRSSRTVSLLRSQPQNASAAKSTVTIQVVLPMPLWQF